MKNKLALIPALSIATLITIVIELPASFAQSKGDSGLGKLKFSTQDEAANEKKALGAEILIASQEEKAITQLKKLLKKYKNTQLEPDLLNRLGELHMRRAKSDRYLEMQRLNAENIRFSPKLIKGAASKKQILAAVDIFNSIEKRYPRYDKIDSVVFNNAFANQQIGNDKVAEKKYLKLLQDYPDSALAPDAHLAIGEIHFQNRQFSKALQNFNAIRKFPDSIVYAYGLYKAAWTYYNMKDAGAGLKELEDVVKYGRFVQENNIDARLDLRKEALLDMALFFEDARPASEAYSYFVKQSGTLDASPSIMRLSDLYKRHSRHNDIRTILSEYINKKNTSVYVPTAYVELMTANDNLKKQNEVLALLGSFYDVCAPDSEWVKAQPVHVVTAKDSPLAQYNEKLGANPTPQAVCAKLVASMNLGYANKWLKIWNKDSRANNYSDNAAEAFALYLSKDSNSADSQRARFVYAELLFKKNKFREASREYAIVGSQTKDVKMLQDSRYFAIASLEKAVTGKWSNDDEALFKALAREYLKTPQPKFKLDVEFKEALIAYEKGKYDEAAPIFLRLGGAYAKETKGVKAQDLYLDIMNIKKDYKSVRDYSYGLRKTANGERNVILTKIYEESAFLLIQKLEEKFEYDQAIKEYTQFSKENPNSKLTSKAQWNVTQLYFKSNQLSLGAESSYLYYKKFPDTKEGKDALLKAAQTYESIGQLKEASDTLLELTKVDVENKDKWLILAADYLTLIGEYSNATPIYKKLRQSGKDEYQFRSLTQLELIAKAQKNTKEHEQYLQEIIKTGNQPHASLASVYFVNKAYENKNYEEAFKLAKQVLSQQKAGASKQALAKARLVQARILDKEFREQSLNAKLDRMQTVLALKIDKLGKSQVAYQSVINYGDPAVAVTAYYELANSYLHYSESLRGMKVPSGVPENEVQLFRDEMEKLAFPMEEKGIETLMVAHKLAVQYNIYDNVTGEILAQMKKYNQHVNPQEGLVKVRPAAVVVPRFERRGT